MELKDFIKETVKAISGSIQELEKEKIYVKKKHMNDISFDVAVTISESTKAEGGGGIKIAVVSVGAEGSMETEASTVSRIKFMITPRHSETGKDVPETEKNIT